MADFRSRGTNPLRPTSSTMVGGYPCGDRPESRLRALQSMSLYRVPNPGFAPWLPILLSPTSVALVVAIEMAELTLHPMRLRPPDSARIAAMYAPYGAGLQPVIIQAADGVELRAWYSVPAQQNGQAVILLHGIGDNRGGVAGYGEAFLREGYRILLPDSPAHGESGGAVATYGLRESDDIHRWVSWLYGKGASCVDGFGESMGAALVLESMDISWEPGASARSE